MEEQVNFRNQFRQEFELLLMKFLWEFSGMQVTKLIDYEDFIERYLLDKKNKEEEEEA